MGAHKQEDSPLTRAQRLSSVGKARRDIMRTVIMTAFVFVIMLVLRLVSTLIDKGGSDRRLTYCTGNGQVRADLEVNPRAVSILMVKIISLWCSHI